MLLWSLPTEHKAHFCFPLLPGLSGLAALVVLAWLTGKLPWRVPRLRPEAVLIGMLAIWIAVKVGYAHGLLNRRSHERPARATGASLARLVPVEHVLYLLGIRDDGILFYFGRPAQAVASPRELPAGPGPVYCLLRPESVRNWPSGKIAEPVQTLTDAQGQSLLLVRVTNP
jgi:hypothetical protein